MQNEKSKKTEEDSSDFFPQKAEWWSSQLSSFWEHTSEGSEQDRKTSRLGSQQTEIHNVVTTLLLGVI